MEKHKDNKDYNIEEEWEDIVDNSNNQIVRMLKYYYVSRNGYITKSKLYVGIKSLEKNDVNKLLREKRNFQLL